MSELVVMSPTAETTALVQRAEDFVRAAKAPRHPQRLPIRLGTLRSLVPDLSTLRFSAEPATVALYITDLAACRAAGTITRRLTPITKAHQSVGLDTPPTTRHLSSVRP